MSIVARPYQRAQLDAVVREWETVRSTLVSSPTGTGKTELFCLAAAHRLESGDRRVLVLAHARKLVTQAAERIERRLGVYPHIEMSDVRGGASTAPIVVGTMQSVYSRLHRLPRERFGTVIVDEAHRTAGATYRQLLAHFNDAKVLGVTATPDRTDRQAIVGAGRLYETLACHYPLYHELEPSAITDGWLVPVRQGYVHVEGLQLSELAKKDFAANEVEKMFAEEETLHSLCAPLPDLLGARPTVVFCATIAQAEATAPILARYAGGDDRVTLVHGKLDDATRDSRLSRYESGQCQYVVTVDALIEGWDCWRTAGVVVARPTKSRSRKAQMVGRGTRTVAGLVDGGQDAADRRRRIAESEKPDVLVLDFYGRAADLSLNVDVLELLSLDGDEPEVLAMAKQRLLADGQEDAAESLRQARDRRRKEKAFLAAIQTTDSRLRGLVAQAQASVDWRNPYGHVRQSANMEKNRFQRPETPGVASVAQRKYAIALGMPPEQAALATPREAGDWIATAKRRGVTPTQDDWRRAGRWAKEVEVAEVA